MTPGPRATDRPSHAPTPRPVRPWGALPLSRYPNVYDAAFSWDRSQEARTYLQVAAARIGRRPRSIVELACGSGPLASLWALWGLGSYGVDRAASAIARARELRSPFVPPSHWVRGNLQSFRLPERVEVAVVPLDGLSYLVEEEEFRGFFGAVRRCLAPRGVLALDLTLHPEGAPPLPIRNTWRVTLRPIGSLEVRWVSRGRPWGSPRRRWEIGEVTAHLPGRPAQVFWECLPHAVLSAKALRGLAERAGGFGEMWAYSDAAHRGEHRRIRRVSGTERAVGSRLICWQRA